MRKTLIDFYFTVLFPLLVIGTVSLWNSVRLYRSASWREDPTQARRDAKLLIWVSALGSISLVLLAFTGNDLKFLVIEGMSGLLGIVSSIAAVYSAGMSWHYAQKRHWPFFALALVAILLSIGAAQHFYRQSENAKHVFCPDCTDDDDHDSDNSFW